MTLAQLDATVTNLIGATSDFDHSMRRAGVIMGLQQANLGHSGTDYTNIDTLKAASKEFVNQGKYSLEIYDAVIAYLEAVQQSSKYGFPLNSINAAETLVNVKQISAAMTEQELHAAETFLRSCLTQ